MGPSSRRIATLAVALSPAAHAQFLDTIAVGSGPDTSTIVVQFSTDDAYRFDVAYTAPLRGFELLDIVEANTSLTTQRTNFGDFDNDGIDDYGLDSLTYDGRTDAGFVNGAYWSYWTAPNDASPFAFASVGASTRLINDGEWDGWYFSDGSTAPVPEPASAAALLAVGTLVTLRRRRA